MVSNQLGLCLGSSEHEVLRSSQAHWERGYLSPLQTPPPKGEGKTSGHDSLSVVSQLTGLRCI